MAAVKAAVDGMDKISTKQLEFAKDKLLMGTERKSMALTEESRKVMDYVEGYCVFFVQLEGLLVMFLGVLRVSKNSESIIFEVH